MSAIPPAGGRNEGLLRKAIRERRFTMTFDGSPVPNEVLTAILNAGNEALSASNLQPWRFLVVSSTEGKRVLREAAIDPYLTGTTTRCGGMPL